MFVGCTNIRQKKNEIKNENETRPTYWVGQRKMNEKKQKILQAYSALVFGHVCGCIAHTLGFLFFF